MTVDEFVAWLGSHGPPIGPAGVREDCPIEGCSEEEIEWLRQAQHVPTLPPPYEAFLRACGRSAGCFRRGTVITHPLVAEAKEWMQEGFEEEGRPSSELTPALVFYCHEGYHFWYFNDVTAEPAAVWEWLEGKEPQPFFRTFEDWLDAEVAYHEFVWARHEAEQFDHEQYRTLW